MNPNYIDCIQGSKEWFDARLGCITSSRVAAVVKKREKASAGKKTTDPLGCYVDMHNELVCELLTNKPTDNYVSRWMKEGKEREPLARAEYEIRFECFIEQVGFIYHPTIKMAGASPDGLVGKHGLVEFKCPRLDTHLEYLTEDVIPKEYIPQLLWQLASDPDREWVDFVSYHPDFPERLQIFKKRLRRGDKIGEDRVEALIRGYETDVEYFNSQVQETLQKLKQRASEALQEVTA